MGEAVLKQCSGCGIDVTRQKRVKDEKGRYYCQSCWSQSTSSDKNAVDPTSSSEPYPAGLSVGEKRLIASGILIAILVAASLTYMLFVRNWWEDHNRDQLLALQKDAQTFARSGRLADAKQRYDQMFILAGDHPIRSDELRQTISSAHDDANKVGAELAAQEQARRDEERHQQEAKASHEREMQAQETAAQHQAAEDHAKAQQAAAQQQEEQQASHTKLIFSIADLCSDLAEAQSKHDEAVQLYNGDLANLQKAQEIPVLERDLDTEKLLTQISKQLGPDRTRVDAANEKMQAIHKQLDPLLEQLASLPQSEIKPLLDQMLSDTSLYQPQRVQLRPIKAWCEDRWYRDSRSQ